jgi:hypothetical protein
MRTSSASATGLEGLCACDRFRGAVALGADLFRFLDVGTSSESSDTINSAISSVIELSVVLPAASIIASSRTVVIVVLGCAGLELEIVLVIVVILQDGSSAGPTMIGATSLPRYLHYIVIIVGRLGVADRLLCLRRARGQQGTTAQQEQMDDSPFL